MPNEEEGYIIEFITVGNSMKVSAIDPVSLKEASIVIPPHTSRDEATKLAVRKLHYLLDKQKGGE